MNKNLHFAGHIAAAIVMIGVGSLAVMLLWNALMPDLFGLGSIDALQALGLLVLARILFGGFGGAHRWLGMRHRKFHHGDIREKWMNMTPDERKEFVKRRMHHEHFHEPWPENKD